jgi:hypothetical protein
VHLTNSQPSKRVKMLLPRKSKTQLEYSECGGVGDAKLPVNPVQVDLDGAFGESSDGLMEGVEVLGSTSR